MNATDNAENQAHAQLEGIQSMIDRLEHIRECDGDDCPLDAGAIMEGIGYSATDIPTEEQRAEYHDEDSARDAIQEDPLSVQVRSGWYTPGDKPEAAEEYEILLCTGGPAVRILGELDEHCQPTSARLQYQDWGTPWTEYVTVGADHAALMAYAQNMYFGE